MRTTLDLDDDLVQAAKELARAEGKTMGQLVSEWARSGLHQSSGAWQVQDVAADEAKGSSTPEQLAYQQAKEQLAQMGIVPIPSRGGVVTNELVRRILDDEGL